MNLSAAPELKQDGAHQEEGWLFSRHMHRTWVCRNKAPVAPSLSLQPELGALTLLLVADALRMLCPVLLFAVQLLLFDPINSVLLCAYAIG